MHISIVIIIIIFELIFYRLASSSHILHLFELET